MGQHVARRLPLAAIALACVAPAALFLVAAVGRSLQPVQHEPARTLDAVVSWFGSLGEPALLVLLMVLPAVGVLLGAGLVAATLREDAALGPDLVGLGRATLLVLRRPAFVLGLLTVLFGVGFLALMAVHAVAG